MMNTIGWLSAFGPPADHAAVFPAVNAPSAPSPIGLAVTGLPPHATTFTSTTPFASTSTPAAPTPLPHAAPPPASSSTKSGTKERSYTEEHVRRAARRILAAGKNGSSLSAAKAAADEGASTMRSTVTRLMEEVWAIRWGATEHVDRWMARHDHIDAYTFPEEGNASFALDRIFSADEEKLLASMCEWAAAGGFGLDAPAVRNIMAAYVSDAGMTSRGC